MFSSYNACRVSRRHPGFVKKLQGALVLYMASQKFAEVCIVWLPFQMSHLALLHYLVLATVGILGMVNQLLPSHSVACLEGELI